jgi:hypothetical protein
MSNNIKTTRSSLERGIDMASRLLKALEDGRIDGPSYIRACVARKYRAGFDSLLEGVRLAVNGRPYHEAISRGDGFGRRGQITSTSITLQWLPIEPTGEWWKGPLLELDAKGLGIRTQSSAWCGYLPIRRLDQTNLVKAMIHGSELYLHLDRQTASRRTTWKAEEEGWKRLKPLMIGYAAHQDLLIGVQTAIDVYMVGEHHHEPEVTYTGQCLRWKLDEVEILLNRQGLNALVGDQVLFHLPPRISEVTGRRQVAIARVAVLGALSHKSPLMAKL